MTHELEMAARHHDFALGELANSRPAAAVKALKQSLALDPKRASAHHDLGLALQDLGRLEEAERAHRDALSLDPSHAAAYLSLGELLQSRGALEEARSCFESALRLARSPAPAGIYMQLGGVLWKLGDSMRALEAFERAVAGAPGSAEAHYNLGSAQLELGRFDAAERSAREVLRLRPGLSEALTLRAAAIAASGSIDAAVELLRQPGGQDAAAAQHYKALAIRLLNSRLFDPARRCLEAVLREDPTEAMAHHLLSALSGANPDHPIEGYVRQLFDASASSFDQELVSKLGYDIPREMVDAVLSIAGAPGERWDVLDLGCGTGLVGERLASCCRRLVGVDLAPNMIERARARNLYTEL